MANTLVITKKPNDYFSFVLNGEVANEILNTRNDLLTIGVEAHFKTSNGANLIKNQKINYNDVTIVDGMTFVVPVSSVDLFNQLKAVGYFDWITATGGTGVNRFDELADTFDYFGNDGKTVIVDEAQLKLIPVTFPNTAGLDAIPFPIIPGYMVVGNASGSAYEQIAIPSASAYIPNMYSNTFDYTSDPQDFTIPSGAKLAFVTMNNVVDNTVSAIQSGTTVTISGYTPTVGYTDKATIYYQI